jgi:glutamyl-tRNA reductase
MTLVAVGLNHKTAPVAIRERLAFDEADLGPAAGRVRSFGIADEVVVVSTCNRVELYAASASAAPATLAARLRDFLASDRGQSIEVPGLLYSHADTAALEHLFRVVSGLDSLVLGETEILGQMKRAYSVALAGGHTAIHLNRAFQRAFALAKRLRTETGIQRGHTSVASVAVGLAERIFEDLDRRRVLVIGAGDTGRATARALRGRGVRGIRVSNRSPDRAAILAGELGGQVVGFHDWAREFEAVDIVLSATGSPHPILDRSLLEPTMAARGTRTLLLVDLAVPRDIDPSVARIPGVILANVDDLQSVAEAETHRRRSEIAHCETLIRDAAAGWEVRRPRGGRADRPSPAGSPCL